jgi:hypothetical protein
MYIRGIAPPLSVIIPHSDQMKKPAVIRGPQALFEIRSFFYMQARRSGSGLQKSREPQP